MDLLKLTISQASQAMCDGEVSSEELTEAYLDRINQFNPSLNAYISVESQSAIKQAKSIDTDRKAGKSLSALAGIPIAIKDIIVTKDSKTTAGSKMLENYQPSYDATVITKLKKAGAVIIGKTNCDEFGLGSSGENSAYGATRNPWDTSRVPGGSSSGSAAAVAAGLALGSLGTDTGSSVRLPAAFTSLVGVKPTYGRVSRRGLIASTSSADTIGVFGKTVLDAALLLQVIAGADSGDATSIEEPVPDYPGASKKNRRKLKIGVVKEYFQKGMNSDVAKTVENAIQTIRGLGHEVVEISLPHAEAALPTYYLINPSEVSSNLARYDGIRYGHSVLKQGEVNSLSEVFERSRDEGFGPESKRRIMLGTFALSRGYADKYYLQAQRVRTLLIQDFSNAFSRVDLLLTPTSPNVAFHINEVQDPLLMYLSDINLCAVNLAGLPAVSIPCGFVDSLPVGLQIIGQPFSESDIFSLAYQYEQETDWTEQYPDMTAVK
ncbi:MAG: Asp-tRNA(Asn)/Glu-tRNA(Gln) amidotransferase subunit GatA [bacterium]